MAAMPSWAFLHGAGPMDLGTKLIELTRQSVGGQEEREKRNQIHEIFLFLCTQNQKERTQGFMG
jgi:hypothetical protein